MKYPIPHLSGRVLFEAEIPDDTEERCRLKIALEIAVARVANLYGACLVNARLVNANLYGARLIGANLYGASLDSASLDSASLIGANLYGASLDSASLDSARLVGANLYGASLDSASLIGACLDGACLVGASFRNCRYDGGLIINQPPVSISGLQWPVVVLDTHMKIGCELHAHDEWAAFADRRILSMDSRAALEFWRQHKEPLLALCRVHAEKVLPAEAAQ